MSGFPEFESPRVFPAIDLRGGRCVRLIRGRRDAEIDYGGDPLDVAGRFRDAGAECLHVIDLGAALGEADSSQMVLELARRSGLPIQAGGGLRSAESVRRLLDGGVGRVILGTRALRDPAFLAAAVAEHGPGRIVVALDCDGERIKVAGWEEESPLDIAQGIDLVRRAGVQSVLVTATDRDGTLLGPRVELVECVLADGGLRVVAAGGIGSLEHVRALLDLRRGGLEGIVVGRALYEGAVDLKAAVELTRAAVELKRAVPAGGSDGKLDRGEMTAMDVMLDGLKYDDKGLITAVVQDAADGQVLMVAYMNREAVRRTLTSGYTCFWSRSRQEYWVKGETSGNRQRVVRVSVDCDQDALLVLVEQKGVACHTGKRSCFFRELRDGAAALEEIAVERFEPRRGI